MRFRHCIAVVVFAFVMSAAAGAQQKPLTAEQQKIADTVTAMLNALGASDAPKFNSVLAPGVYMFDGGKRYEGDGLLTSIQKMLAAGWKAEWTVNEPDVHITDNTAWIAYVNRGSFTDPKGAVRKESWLESAFLEKQGRIWKIVFFQSTPIAEPKPQAQ